MQAERHLRGRGRLKALSIPAVKTLLRRQVYKAPVRALRFAISKPLALLDLAWADVLTKAASYTIMVIGKNKIYRERRHIYMSNDMRYMIAAAVAGAIFLKQLFRTIKTILK